MPHPLPVQVKQFPKLVLAPDQPFTEINLAQYIENPPGVEQALQFLVRFEKGELPMGFSLSPEGIFSIAPAESQRRAAPYQFVVYADNGGRELFSADLMVLLQTVESPVETPPPEEPVAEIPAPTEIPVEEPVAETPAPTETPAEEPAAESPVPTEAAPEEPVAETPAPTEIPVEEPVAETPAPTETPAEEPVAEPPVPTEELAEEFSDESSIEYLHGKAYQKIKSEIWQKIFDGETPEEITQLFSGNPTFAEIYYMIGRFADFVIWNADDHVPPGALKELPLDGLSEHFKVIDRGPCLVSLPLDLYSHERTLTDSLEVARLMAREVFKRGWRVEFGGFDKMVSAAWVELQLCMKREKNSISIVFYEPSQYDYFLLDQAMKKESEVAVAE
jgi:hypothetical protein